MIIYMDLVIEKEDFDKYFETLCDLIKLEESL